MQNQQPTPNGSVVAPAAPTPFTPPAPGQATGANAPLSSPGATPAVPAKRRGVAETIILIVAALIAVVFIGLYIHKYIQWKEVSTDVNTQIDQAVALAVAENTTKMEEEFIEREKNPYRDFMGPEDYGSLSFQYPRTWSVYIASDAVNGGDFAAYLNPTQVEPISLDSINALRVTIRNTPFDTVAKTYESFVTNGKLSFSTRNVGGVLANLYTGTLPNNLQGAVVIFKLRDKTVVLQTDAEIFLPEFYTLLDTVTMVQ